MPCYNPPEYILITLNDLSIEKQKELLKVCPSLTAESKITSFEVPDEMDFYYYKLLEKGYCDVASTFKISEMPELQLYTYEDYDGYCSARIFGRLGSEIFFCPAWIDLDANMRFTEIKGDKIQYIQVDYDLLKEMTIDQAMEYINTTYEKHMSNHTPPCEGFDVYESYRPPAEIIQTGFLIEENCELEKAVDEPDEEKEAASRFLMDL